jgi:hypothetical protein
VDYVVLHGDPWAHSGISTDGIPFKRDLDSAAKIHRPRETRDGGKESAAADLIAKGYFDADESVKSDDR